MIVANDENIKEIVHSEIKRLGNKADLNHIDVSQVTNMFSLFEYSEFNGDISKWDVSNVENMNRMFFHSSFNGDISKWDVSNVENMGAMFYYSQFNQDISGWDVSNVKSMRGMFYESKFNQDISNWNINLKNLKEEPDDFDFNNTKFIESLFKAYENNNKNDIDNLSRKVYINHIRKRLKI